MTFKGIAEGVAHVQNESNTPILFDVQSALDLIATAWYEGNYTKLIIMKEDIFEDFFDLKTKIAGEILQKFVNYGICIAIVGDFSGYSSKSLRDFMYESNKSQVICFMDTIENAIITFSS